MSEAYFEIFENEDGYNGCIVFSDGTKTGKIYTKFDAQAVLFLAYAGYKITDEEYDEILEQIGDSDLPFKPINPNPGRLKVRGILVLPANKINLN